MILMVFLVRIGCILMTLDAAPHLYDFVLTHKDIDLSSIKATFVQARINDSASGDSGSFLISNIEGVSQKV